MFSPYTPRGKPSASQWTQHFTWCPMPSLLVHWHCNWNPASPCHKLNTPFRDSTLYSSSYSQLHVEPIIEDLDISVRNLRGILVVGYTSWEHFPLSLPLSFPLSSPPCRPPSFFPHFIPPCVVIEHCWWTEHYSRCWGYLDEHGR